MVMDFARGESQRFESPSDVYRMDVGPSLCLSSPDKLKTGTPAC
jgi:hypothetical protein